MLMLVPSKPRSPAISAAASRMRARPDATEAALVDGWLRTGDLGSLDSDGDLRIVDRLKELIIRGGYNVYPREVEEVLYQHPGVVEAAVIVLRKDAYLKPEALRAWAKERLSPYKVPHLFRFVSALPKGPSSKILKRDSGRHGFAREPTG